MNVVAMFCDRGMLPGLHTTVASLLATSVRRADLRLILFSDAIPDAEKLLLEHTVGRRPPGRFEIRDFSPTVPGGANRLVGNATTYGRLSLSRLLPDAARCVYLDSDLIVSTPIEKLFDFMTRADGDRGSRATLTVGGCGRRRFTLDRRLYEEAGLAVDGPAFNAGVLGIDLDRWRRIDADGRCARTVQAYPGRFASADQSVLNVALHDEFVSAGEQFNAPVYAGGPRLSRGAATGRIFHFVGVPKPWDFGGSWLHNSYALWRDWADETALADRPAGRYRSARRTARIAPALFRRVRARAGESCGGARQLAARTLSRTASPEERTDA